MDFDKILEDLIQAILRLLLGVFKVGYEFLKNPAVLAKPPTPDPSRNTIGPLTFCLVSLILFVGELLVIKAFSKGTRVEILISPSPEEWSKALTKPDPKALLKAAAPFVALMAGHAAFLRIAFGLFGSNIPYRSVFSAGCYLVGIFFLLCAILGAGYIIILPRRLRGLRVETSESLPKPDTPIIFSCLVGLLPALVVLKAVHSYFAFLLVFSSTSTLLTIAAWLAGSAAFIIAVMVASAWFEPAIFPDSLAQEIRARRSGSKPNELKHKGIDAE